MDLNNTGVPLPPAVPDPWDAVYDAEEQKYYFMNRETCEAQWEIPSATDDDDNDDDMPPLIFDDKEEDDIGDKGEGEDGGPNALLRQLAEERRKRQEGNTGEEGGEGDCEKLKNDEWHTPPQSPNNNNNNNNNVREIDNPYPPAFHFGVQNDPNRDPNKDPNRDPNKDDGPSKFSFKTSPDFQPAPTFSAASDRNPNSKKKKKLTGAGRFSRSNHHQISTTKRLVPLRNCKMGQNCKLKKCYFLHPPPSSSRSLSSSFRKKIKVKNTNTTDSNIMPTMHTLQRSIRHTLFSVHLRGTSQKKHQIQS